MLRKVRKMANFGRTKEIVIERSLLVMFFFFELSGGYMGICFVIIHWAVHFCIVYFADWKLYFTIKKGVFILKNRIFLFSCNCIRGKCSEYICIMFHAPFLKPRGEWDIKIFISMIPVFKKLTILWGRELIKYYKVGLNKQQIKIPFCYLH